ncbi:hypothetical protein D3C78_1603830 [compost metagenome]
MEPIQVVGIVLTGGRHRQAAVAVAGQQVFHDGGGFGQHHVAVRNDGRGAQRVQRLVLRRRQPRDRIAVIDLQVVRDGEFLAQPHDAFGLRFSQMMHGQHELPL